MEQIHNKYIAQDTKKMPNYILGVILLILIFFLSICNIDEPLFLSGIFLSIFLIWLNRKYIIRLTYFDLCIFIIWLYSLFGTFNSSEIITSFMNFKIFTITILYYFIIRIFFNTKQKIKYLLLGISVIIGIISSISLASFILFRNGVEQVGFDNLYSFRFLYKPMGYLSNIWSSLLITFTGILYMSMIFFSKNKVILLILYIILLLVLFEIIISFSRGTYLSFSFILVFTLIHLITTHLAWYKKILIGFLIIIPILVFGSLFKNEVLRTIKFSETISQQKSLSGRLDSITASYKIFKNYSIFGTGPGTYNMVINDLKYEDDNQSFTNFSPNTYIELLVEQGISGLCLWVCLYFLFLLSLYKIWKYPHIREFGKIIFIIITAILIREASFPVFFKFSGYQLLIISILAIAFNTFNLKLRSISLPKRSLKYINTTLIFVCMLILFISIIHANDKHHNKIALDCLDKGRLKEAEIHISKTSNRLPYLINRYIIYWKIYNQTHDTLSLIHAQKYLEKAITKNPHDIMLQYYRALIFKYKGYTDMAAAELKNLSKRFPNNSLYNFATFNILYQNKQTKQSIPYLTKAISLSPQIIKSTFWENLNNKDSALVRIIVNQLNSFLNHSINDSLANTPIVLAKYGCLLLFLERNTEAKQVLNKVTSLMPQLSYPWFYLYLIETSQNNKEIARNLMGRFLLLNYNIQSRNDIDSIIQTREFKWMTKERNIINNNYNMKFKEWYKSPTSLIN